MVTRYPSSAELPLVTADHPTPNGTPAQPRVLTPTLAIFPGTTAAYAALEFMHQARDLPEGDRRRIALVHIDIDHLHPDLVAFRSGHPGLFTERIVRIGVPRHVSQIERLEQGGVAGEPHTYVVGKAPDAFENGARGIRNNGHVAFCHNAVDITNNLTDAITQITSRDANDGQQQPKGVHVHIASFIGGGTASGIVADLVCLVRQLLDAQDLDPRITVTCILPTIGSYDDTELRRANAVACLLEIIALSEAGGPDGTRYSKYLREDSNDLPPGAIAHEVYLVGNANISDPRDIARIAGLDLFMRALDATGVGALERTESVNRISLGSQDDRGLPTMFGTACPVEARFPVRETALAFAQMAASEVLPLLAGYHPEAPPATDAERKQWQAWWSRVARIGTNEADKLVVRVPDLPRGKYHDFTQRTLDARWGEVEKAQVEITRRVQAVLLEIGREQEALIDGGGGPTPKERNQHWQRLRQEYAAALADLRAQPVAREPQRPTKEENRAVAGGLLGFGKKSAERALYDADRAYLADHARGERWRLLEVLLEHLDGRASEQLTSMSVLAATAGAELEAKELGRRAEGSAAWRAELDRPHPFQFHALDLNVLRGPEPQVQRVYEWATGAIGGMAESGNLDYHRFLPLIADAIDVQRLGQSREQLSQAVVRLLEARYQRQLSSMNLLDLLARALPPEQQGPDSQAYADRALAELLDRMKNLMTNLVAFDKRIGGAKSFGALKSEVFLSCHVREGSDDEARIRTVATNVVAILRSGSQFRMSADPHRIQASFMNHGISLSTIYDFFSPVNSSMERYLRLRGAWARSPVPGNPPPHTCAELETLVTELDIVRRLTRGDTGGGPPPPPGPPGGMPRL